MEKPIITWQKNADKSLNKISLPKQIVEKYGRCYYLHLMPNGTLILEPIKKEK